MVINAAYKDTAVRGHDRSARSEKQQGKNGDSWDVKQIA
jgi:hypothetical protein